MTDVELMSAALDRFNLLCMVRIACFACRCYQNVLLDAMLRDGSY